MTVKVRYSGQARTAADAAGESLALDGAPGVPGLLRALAERHGEPLRAMLLDAAGALQPALLVFVNDEQVPRGEAPALKDGDEVTIMAPISGG